MITFISVLLCVVGFIAIVFGGTLLGIYLTLWVIGKITSGK
jgi:hypothetical protein